MNFSARGRARCKFGTPHISETVGVRKLKFYTHLERDIPLFGNENFSARGCVRGGAAPATVSLGPPYIWETIRVRKLKFYTHLDGAKYSFRVRKFFR